MLGWGAQELARCKVCVLGAWMGCTRARKMQSVCVGCLDGVHKSSQDAKCVCWVLGWGAQELARCKMCVRCLDWVHKSLQDAKCMWGAWMGCTRAHKMQNVCGVLGWGAQELARCKMCVGCLDGVHKSSKCKMCVRCLDGVHKSPQDAKCVGGAWMGCTRARKMQNVCGVLRYACRRVFGVIGWAVPPLYCLAGFCQAVF